MSDIDACLSTCINAKCGDSVVWKNVEECDDGDMDENNACRNNCKNAKCGDMVVQNVVEQCDDGNLSETDGCLNNCKDAMCGDGKVQVGVDECDDGNMSDTDACRNNCKNARCGDMVVQDGVEECDDGNMTDDDACSNACVAPRFIFVSSSGVLNAKFGTMMGGIAEANKLCSDWAENSTLIPNVLAGKKWRAWLSDSMGSPANASGILGFTGWYINPKNQKIAHGVNGLTSGAELFNPINVDQNGEPVMQDVNVWTGTRFNGAIAVDSMDAMINYHCDGWTSSAAMKLGLQGDCTKKDKNWTDAADQEANQLTVSCIDMSNRIYCIEIR
jgi:cysteine-rich repeat protein